MEYEMAIELNLCTCNNPRDEMQERKPSILLEAVDAVKKILEGDRDLLAVSDEHISFLRSLYLIPCVVHKHSNQLFVEFINLMENNITSKVLPTMVNKQNSPFLTALLHSWTRYKKMARSLSTFYEYLIPVNYIYSLEPVFETAIFMFCDMVSDPLWDKLQDAIIHLINQDRAGKPIDRILLWNAIDFLQFMTDQGTNYYERFMQVAFKDAATRYSRLASRWIDHHGVTAYIQKVEMCLSIELKRTALYIPKITSRKLVKHIRSALLEKLAMEDYVELIAHEQMEQKSKSV